MTVISTSKVLKMIALITVLALMARAVTPDACMQVDLVTRINTPTYTHVKLIFGNGDTAEETAGCLNDCEWAENALTCYGIQQDPEDPDKRAKIVELLDVKDRDEFVRFKSLWNEEKAGEVEQAKDLTADEFVRFFRTAGSLKLPSANWRRLAMSMLNHGLLGKHSAGITSDPLGAQSSPRGEVLAWEILLVFANQLGFRVGASSDAAVFYPACQPRTGEFEKTVPAFKEIGRVEDLGLGPVTKAMLVGLIPAGDNKHSVDHAAVFSWLFCHAKLSSLSLSLGVEPSRYSKKEKLPAKCAKELSRNLSSLAQPRGEMQVVVEGLDLTRYALEFDSVRAVLEKCPQLRKVKMYITEQLAVDDLAGLSAFPELESVCVLGAVQRSSLVKQLTSRMPKLKQLEIKLEEGAKANLADFSGCSELVALKLDGFCQKSSFLEKLAEELSAIELLTVFAAKLDDTVPASLSKCQKLETLHINGVSQTSSFAQQLPGHMPALKDLKMVVDSLNRDVGSSLSNHSKLRRLELFGELAPGFFAGLLKDPLLSSLSEVEVCKLAGSQACSAKDHQAIAAAEARGISVKIRDN